jgi:hypothetical protein
LHFHIIVYLALTHIFGVYICYYSHHILYYFYFR